MQTIAKQNKKIKSMAMQTIALLENIIQQTIGFVKKIK